MGKKWNKIRNTSVNYKNQTLNVYNIHITLTPSNFYQREHQSPLYFSGCSLTMHIRRVSGFRLKFSRSLASNLHFLKNTYNNEYMLWNISSLLPQNSSSSSYSTPNMHHRKPCNSCYNFACIKITLLWVVAQGTSCKMPHTCTVIQAIRSYYYWCFFHCLIPLKKFI